jgi:hypothetical protein
MRRDRGGLAQARQLGFLVMARPAGEILGPARPVDEDRLHAEFRDHDPAQRLPEPKALLQAARIARDCGSGVTGGRGRLPLPAQRVGTRRAGPGVEGERPKLHELLRQRVV